MAKGYLSDPGGCGSGNCREQSFCGRDCGQDRRHIYSAAPTGRSLCTGGLGQAELIKAIRLDVYEKNMPTIRLYEQIL